METKQFASNCWRNQDLPEQSWQQILKSDAIKKAVVKKAKPKKLVVAPPDPLPWRHALPGETLVGVVDDYYSHLSVITLKVQSPLTVGDKIHVRGHTTDMTETLESMQIDHVPVTVAKVGDPSGSKRSANPAPGTIFTRSGKN